ncbi:hypothetical protein GUJ93_ZPchr0002g24581 [Zizania palustris]|uniref:Uncharacterized protein n=1 Tax=Zizania palustris TaxID=103762 RepID=A0A8J5SPJ3_ZIZPA|nr:hypothetical protein GUJ93_ZPchr0002g24581 [Zizania palustris]
MQKAVKLRKEILFLLDCWRDKRNDQGAGCCFDGPFAGELQAQLQAYTDTEWPHRAALSHINENPKDAAVIFR